MVKDTPTDDNRIMRAIQRFLDRHIPDRNKQKWAWFVLLWLAGISALFVFAYGIRLIMGIA
jgi:hypothetical protein